MEAGTPSVKFSSPNLDVHIGKSLSLEVPVSLQRASGSAAPVRQKNSCMVDQGRSELDR